MRIFKNLKAEMARSELSKKTVADGIGVTEKTLRNKIESKTEFTRREMIIVRNKFFPTLELEYLFELKE